MGAWSLAAGCGVMSTPCPLKIRVSTLAVISHVTTKDFSKLTPISHLHFLAHCDVIEQPAKTDTLAISDHKGFKAS